jgi:dienelactone hydrolase
MLRSASLFAVLLAGVTASCRCAAEDPGRVLEEGKGLVDRRLGPPRTLNDKDFFLHVPATKAQWEARRQQVREQVLVALGLWPMPPKEPLQPTIHGKIDRDDYTVEKVFFASLPGHYVSGNLYRPKGRTGRLAGVLCPHGHWRNGRFYDAGEVNGQNEIKGGGEKNIEGARYPLQARCAQLARMGCVVFHYDMIGYADSQAIEHTKGLTDVSALLRLQSFMGLQAWNSIRALDFLVSLPEVDASRIGVTGASGGGTQTFILCGIDDRPAAAFPAVMVSTEMQGGCICENCPYLRIGTGNIELAGLFAPKPLGMSAANDWTLNIEKRGLPELKQLYQLYDAEDRVMARCHPEFGHNYNQVSRELMYNWFNKHLKLGLPEPIVERPFKPVLPAELSVYTPDHACPRTATSAEVCAYLTATSDKAMKDLRPSEAKGMEAYRRVLGTALRAMVQDQFPQEAKEVESEEIGDKTERDGLTWRRYLLGRKGQGEQVPAIGIKGPAFDGTVVVWVHPEGKASIWKDGKLTAEAKRVLDAKAAILAVDVFGTGEFGSVKPKVDEKYAGYTFGYNRPLLAKRIHDIVTAVAFAAGHEKTKKVHLVGWEKAGPWVLLARPLCQCAVDRTAADFDGFRFESITRADDEMMLPGALKYGGLGALSALIAPSELYVHNHRGTGMGASVLSAYSATGATAALHHDGDKVSPEKVLEWLLR